VVDKAVLAKRIAGIRDAVARIKLMLPATAEEFAADRTAREVVILNLFVALQDTLALAVHWLADEGSDVPQAYRDVFTALGAGGVLPLDLATRLAAASGLRNLVAHQYGTLDWTRIHAIATTELDDLLQFCRELAQRAEGN
jgi:uncharacterized protein YutE (UPF0331/DUF86 family)